MNSWICLVILPVDLWQGRTDCNRKKRVVSHLLEDVPSRAGRDRNLYCRFEDGIDRGCRPILAAPGREIRSIPLAAAASAICVVAWDRMGI